MMPEKKVFSFPNIRYPSLRDGGLRDADQWLKGKSLDDGAEGLWRVHDKLYDLEKYIKKHPGGQQWLLCTKNTDITEVFESHHISTLPEKILKQFYVRDAKTKRNSPFTFKDDGFYRTLKSRVRPELAKIPKSLNWKSKITLDALLLSTFALSISIFYTDSVIMRSVLAFLAAVINTFTVVSAHNFLHQRDNWRMYVYGLSFTPATELRITHGLSHHMFPNTLWDIEISVLEPFFEYMVWKSKTILTKMTLLVIITPFAYLIFWDMVFFRNIYSNVLLMKPLKWEQLIPFSLPLAMYVLGSGDLLAALGWWCLILPVSSLINAIISYSAGHHHPDVFHEGDKARSEQIDWGVYQVECMIDRVETRGNFFRSLTHFGDHALHHLFPTVDHARLEPLYPLVEKTCEEFGTRIRLGTQLECMKGNFQQMVKVQP